MLRYLSAMMKRPWTRRSASLRGQLVCSALVALVTSGCVAPYKPPTENEPHAILKVRRVYETSRGTELLEALRVSDHPAFDQSTAANLATAPKSDALLIHPRPERLRVSGTFVHYELRQVLETYQVQVPYSSMESYSCGTSSSPRMCSRSVTRYRSESRQRWVTRSVQVVDATCARDTTLAPSAGGIYLLEFTFREEGVCSLVCYEQTKRGDDGELANAHCPEATPAQLAEIDAR